MSENNGNPNRTDTPRDFESLREVLLARRDGLPKRLAQVAVYALDNPDEIAFGTAAGIAAKADVQPSALIRFAQALGYQGFSELQDVFRARLRDRVLNYDERMARMREHGLVASESGVLLDGFLEASERSLSRFRETADHAAIDAAVRLLANADTIYLIGLRRSFPVACYASYAMAKLGIRNMLIDAIAGLGPEQSGLVTPRDAVLSISFTPYAAETVALTNAARHRGAKVVSISDSVFSPISTSADALIEVAEADFEGFRSMATTLALAMTLAVAVAARRG